jgi:hypothetical protein
VKVNVQREVAPEPLHGGDAAGAWVEDAEPAALVSVPGLDHASRHAVHRERELVSIGQGYAQLEGEREHPLAYPHARQHRAHPVARHLRHSAPHASRAEAAPFAREPHQSGVLVNEVPSFRVDNMPYGGVKESGLGREGVRYAMEDMTEIRLLVIKS